MASRQLHQRPYESQRQQWTERLCEEDLIYTQTPPPYLFIIHDCPGNCTDNRAKRPQSVSGRLEHASVTITLCGEGMRDQLVGVVNNMI